MNLPALIRYSQQDVYMALTILGCTVNCRFRFADCPLIHCGTYNHNYWIIAAGNRQNGQKLIEKSGLSHLRRFVIVIRSA